MYFDSVVAIPSEKGKIITKKKGNATYVLYQYGQVYKPDKKYAIPQRTVIGKVRLLKSGLQLLYKMARNISKESLEQKQRKQS